MLGAIGKLAAAKIACGIAVLYTVTFVYIYGSFMYLIQELNNKKVGKMQAIAFE